MVSKTKYIFVSYRFGITIHRNGLSSFFVDVNVSSTLSDNS